MIFYFILIKIAFFRFLSNLDFNDQKQGDECLGKFEKCRANTAAC